MRITEKKVDFSIKNNIIEKKENIIMEKHLQFSHLS